MKLDFRNPAVSAAIAAVVLIVAGPGYWFYRENAKEAQREVATAIVAEATKTLGQAQVLRGAEGEAVELDRLAKAADEPIARLQKTPEKIEPRLFEAAETYVVDVQRVLRRQASLVRVRDATAAAQNALMQHMAQASNRSDDWIRDAVALRARLEKQFFEFRTSAQGYSNALEALPPSRKAVLDNLPGAPVYVEADIGKLQTRAAEDAKAATEELEALKKLPPPR